jgi:hypothetical protein
MEEEIWLGGLDSNQDSQIQSLESYQLDDLPAVEKPALSSTVASATLLKNSSSSRPDIAVTTSPARLP